MSPVHKLSAMGSITSNKIDYPSMLAGYGDFGALQRIGYAAANASNTTNPMSFTSIPQTFQDLILVVYGRATNSDTITDYAMTLNNDNSSLYSRTMLQGDGSSATSARTSSDAYAFIRYGRTGANATSGIFGANVIHFLNYANTSTNKTFIARNATDVNGSGWTTLTAHLYRSTFGISRIDLFSNGGNWTFGSTAALYGVRASAA